MKIALLGYGVVGGGTHTIINESVTDTITVTRVLVRRDREDVRDIAVRDFSLIVSDPDIDAVVEVMGGENPAYSYVKAALSAGKSVVTANKLMLSLHYEELLALARENGVHLAFSAAAGGGIPWLVNLLHASRVDRVNSLGGIMNGTTNYILTEMERGGSFDNALASAQRLGYAEADPSADIDGLDVRAKLALSCDAAFGMMADASAIPALGIRHIAVADIERAHGMNMTCRLIGRAERTADGVAAYVEPMFVPSDSPAADVKDTGNMLSYSCSRLGTQSFIGLGAGREPTAAAVVRDLLDISAGSSAFDLAACSGSFRPQAGDVEHPYYLRTDADVPVDMAHDCLGSADGGFAYITRPMSVNEMHSFVGNVLASGKRAFAAGIA